MSSFASVVLDMDSTVASVEGIDWLAKRCEPEVAREIASLTARAMNGEMALDDVYGARLALIRPDAKLIRDLAVLYEQSIVPGAADAIARLRRAGVKLVIVSGGILQAILPAARALGFADSDAHAVRLYFDSEGRYTGFDEASPLVSQNGKATVVRELALTRPILAVGDGSTDAALRSVVDSFAAFTGVVRRESVVAQADRELHSFDQLPELVLA